MDSGSLAARLAELGRRLPPATHLLAVSKGQDAEAIREAVALGQRSFGESRLQEAQTKQEQLADLGPLDWHFIGRLQANKARGVLRHFGTIHSVDSLELAERLRRIAAEEGLAPAVLFQVKFRPDPAKTGFSVEEFRQAWPLLRDLAPLCPVGLMTIPPQGLTAEERRRLFQDCADLAAEHGLKQLSMGMSGDWPEAVAAGSTWVRLGTTLFGARPGISSPQGPEALTNTD
ncbi:MAG: YggS family pyridoxal phosphate-dependent enzyme [Cyanobium sp.]